MIRFVLDDQLQLARRGGGVAEESRQLAEEDFERFEEWIGRYEKHVNEPEALKTLGGEMFRWMDRERWLTNLPETTGPKTIGFQIPLESSEPKTSLFLRAPWEILANENRFLGCLPVRRIGEPEAPPQPSDSRLSILFMAAAPEGQNRLDFEGEEARITQAVGKIPLDLTVEETGELKGLHRTWTDSPADVLHLSCHGGIENGNVVCALEKEDGSEHRVAMKSVLEKLGKQPKLFFFSACHSGANIDFPLAAARSGVPAVLGWRAEVGDRSASFFAKELYAFLVNKRSLEDAVGLAWHKLREEEEKEPSQNWHKLCFLLGKNGGGVLAKGNRRKTGFKPEHHADFLGRDERIPVASYREFVGRRREIQKCMRAFSDDGNKAIMLWGFGRQGKSSVAARVLHRLPTQHYQAVILHRKFTRRDLWAGLKNLRFEAKIQPLLDQIPQRDTEIYARLAQILQDIKKPFVLILDDFECALDESREFSVVKAELHETIKAIFRAFQNNAGACNLLLTCRYDFKLEDSGEDLTSWIEKIQLAPTEPRMAFRQLVKKLDAQEKNFNELRENRVESLIRAAKGNAGLQDVLTRLLLEDEKKFEQVLEQIKRRNKEPQNLDPQVLDFFRNLALEKLYELFGRDEKQALQNLSLFRLPLPRSVFKRFAPETELTRAIRLGFVLPLEDKNIGEDTYLLNPLGASPLEPLQNGAIQTVLAQSLDKLAEVWKAQNQGPFSVELTRLACLSKNMPVIQNSADEAIHFLMETFDYRQAKNFALDILLLSEATETGLNRMVYAKCGNILEMTGKLDQAKTCYEQALELSETEEEQAPLIVLVARMLTTKGQVEEALNMHEQAIKAFEKIKDEKSKTVVLSYVARILTKKGRIDEALGMYEQAIEVFEKIKDEKSKAVVLGDAARILTKKGRIDEALGMHEQAIKVYEKIGDPRNKAIALGDVARILNDKGQVDKALSMHEQRIEVFEKIGDQRNQAVALGDVARILTIKGQVDEALGMYKEIIKVLEKMGDEREKAVALGDVARILTIKGQVDEALSMHEQRIKTFEKIGDQGNKAVAIGDVARILTIKGRIDEALSMYEQAIEAFEKIGDERSKSITLFDLSQILFDKNPRKATDYLKESFTIAVRLENAQGIAQAGRFFGTVLIQGGYVQEARPVLERSLEAYRLLKDEESAEAIQTILKQIESSKEG